MCYIGKFLFFNIVINAELSFTFMLSIATTCNRIH